MKLFIYLVVALMAWVIIFPLGRVLIARISRIRAERLEKSLSETRQLKVMLDAYAKTAIEESNKYSEMLIEEFKQEHPEFKDEAYGKVFVTLNGVHAVKY